VTSGGVRADDRLEERLFADDLVRFLRHGLQYEHLTRRVVRRLVRRLKLNPRTEKYELYQKHVADPEGFLKLLDALDAAHPAPEGRDALAKAAETVKGMISPLRDYARRGLAKAKVSGTRIVIAPVRACVEPGQQSSVKRAA
jgi:hypothetical protein